MTERTELPRLATRSEAAAALKVSVRTVDRLIANGKLKVAHPTPTSVRITHESIALLASPISAPSPSGVDAGAPAPNYGAPATSGGTA